MDSEVLSTMDFMVVRSIRSSPTVPATQGMNSTRFSRATQNRLVVWVLESIYLSSDRFEAAIIATVRHPKKQDTEANLGSTRQQSKGAVQSRPRFTPGMDVSLQVSCAKVQGDQNQTSLVYRRKSFHAEFSPRHTNPRRTPMM